MSNKKDVDLPRHAWDTPPFPLIVSPTPPVQSVDAYVRTYVRSVNHVTTKRKKVDHNLWVCGSVPLSTAWNDLPGRTQNKWSSVIGPMNVPFGSFIPTDAQSFPPDCFINNSKEYDWHLLNHISLDVCWEGNLKKLTNVSG